MEYYVYRFLDKRNKVLYVGRTSDLSKRLIAHFNNKDPLAMKRNEITEKIQFVTFERKTYCAIYEIFLINLWKPKYNIIDKYDEEIDQTFLSLENLYWEEILAENLTELKAKIGIKSYRLKIVRKISDEEKLLFASYESAFGISFTRSEQLVLAVLKRNADKELTTSELIGICGISRSTMTRTVARLTELGLIEKQKTYISNGIRGENKFKSKTEDSQ